MPIRSILFTALCTLAVPAAHAADSTIDPTFGVDGWKRLYQPGGGTQDERGVGFARTADGGYVVVVEVPGGAANGGTGKRIGLVTRLDADGSPDTGFGIGGTYAYAAPGGTASSYYTTFEQVRFDGFRPVMLGSAVDNSTAVSDSDAVITRLQSDVIFANGYDA